MKFRRREGSELNLSDRTTRSKSVLGRRWRWSWGTTAERVGRRQGREPTVLM